MPTPLSISTAPTLSAILQNTATVSVTFVYDVDSVPSRVGVCFNKTADPVVEPVMDVDTTVDITNADGTNPASAALTALDADTEYTIRAFAVGDAGIVYSEPTTFSTDAEPVLQQLVIDFRSKVKGVQQDDNFPVKNVCGERTILPITEEDGSVTDGVDVMVLLPSERVAILIQSIVTAGTLQILAFNSVDGVNWNTVAPVLSQTHVAADGSPVDGIDPLTNLMSKFLKLRFCNKAGETVNAVVTSINITLQRIQ
jgi:hypothetical protein